MNYEAIESLARRFAGLDLQCRNGGTDWPDRWRAAIVANKNERADHRIETFGATAEDALKALMLAQAWDTARTEAAATVGTIGERPALRCAMQQCEFPATGLSNYCARHKERSAP